jgi:type IV secretory pathway VirB2 component (pilin)
MIGTQRTFLKFLAVHLAGGTAGAVAIVGGILATDLAGLRTLMLTDSHGWLALALLVFGLIITFGSVAMGVGIMGLGRERDGRHNSDDSFDSGENRFD